MSSQPVPGPAPSPAPSKESLLHADHHAALEALLVELKETARSGYAAALCECWTRFETLLDQHLTAEEKHLLPAFEKQFPAEAKALLRDHNLIREIVGVLGVHVDLHAVRFEVADRLIRLLQDHAKREDALLYPWAEKHLHS